MPFSATYTVIQKEGLFVIHANYSRENPKLFKTSVRSPLGSLVLKKGVENNYYIGVEFFLLIW